MPRQDNAQQAMVVHKTRDEKRTATSRRPNAKVRAAATETRSTPLEIHRLLAALCLVLLLVLSAIGPVTPVAGDTSAFLTPKIDGSNPLDEHTLFPYTAFLQRQVANPASAWPDVSEVLSFSPSSDRVRRAIVAGIYASTTSIKQTIAESGLASSPGPDILTGIQTSYEGQAAEEDATKHSRGLNGLGAVALIRALNAPEDQRAELEAIAVDQFQQAISASSATWQYSYNWSLANFLAGNYSASYEGMKSVIPRAEADFNVLAQFWAALSVLRAGDPGDAIVRLSYLLDRQPANGGNEALLDRYKQLHTLSREVLGDAQWANRDPASAYKTYFDTLRLSAGDTTSGPYDKWLRLGLQQRGYEGLLADMSTLINTSSGLGNDPRLHHDRARLLSFLGRNSEAIQEYRKAADLGQNDVPLLISYGESLANSGDYNGALTKAQDAIRGLGNDPGTVNLKSVAQTATNKEALLTDVEMAQELLDANLLRARVFGRQNNSAGLDSLVQGITQEAATLSPEQGGLLLMYGAFTNEVAGRQTQARDGFSAAWDKLKGLPSGTPGRAASLSGLARTTAAAQNPGVALDLLKANGYDPASPTGSVVTDVDAPDILSTGSTLLTQAGRSKEAANALRVSAVTRNVQDAHSLTGVGRPLWVDNGTNVPADAILAAADAQRVAGDNGLAVMRYKQAYGLTPALAPAWNNLGVLYAQQGNSALADFYLRSAGFVSPNYAWGQHNYATYSYKQGFGNFFSAEGAAGSAVKAAGPTSLLWGSDLRYDERGLVPAPSSAGNDILSRLPALLILALLLFHTIVGRDLITNRVVVPTRGLLGRLAATLDARFKLPGRGGMGALLSSLAIPSIIGMLGLAWGAARGSLEVALVFLPVALLAALLAFAANELVQYAAARRAGVSTVHHNWLLGMLLGVVSIPFGFVYGWQINTRLAAGSEEDTSTDASDGHAHQGKRAVRSLEERELLYEVQAEAAADEAVPLRAQVGGVSTVQRGLGLTSGARIMFAGMVANLLLGLIFGLIYWLTGWPSMRLALFAQALVLAFTAASEPPADGWTLYRRNAPLWLATFVFAAIVVTLLAVGLI